MRIENRHKHAINGRAINEGREIGWRWAIVVGKRCGCGVGGDEWRGGRVREAERGELAGRGEMLATRKREEEATSEACVYRGMRVRMEGRTRMWADERGHGGRDVNSQVRYLYSAGTDHEHHRFARLSLAQVGCSSRRRHKKMLPPAHTLARDASRHVSLTTVHRPETTT